MPEAGDVLYIKTSEEPVVYLYEHKKVYWVRRPIQTFLGLFYRKTWFHPFELETGTEQIARLMDRIKSRNAIALADMEPENNPMSSGNLVPYKKPS
jgi:hypothetical protein